MHNSCKKNFGEKFAEKFVDDRLNSNPVALFIFIIPLKWKLKCLLESPKVFKLITDNMTKSYSEESSIFSNQIQGRLWQNIIKYMKGKFVVS